MLDRIIKGWFSEIDEQWPGVALSLKIKKVLYEGKTKYQKIAFYETETFGIIMTLDDVIQITERDEFAYQEMIVHLPLFAHPNPRNILVVGGGDGGVLREIAKHKSVEKIDLCEIDEEVIKHAKKWLPYAASGYDEPRVSVHIEDGATFVKKFKSAYDVIIVDSSDPEGPARALFEAPFYKDLSCALTPGGVICSQAESMWLHGPLIKGLIDMSREIFPSVEYAFTTIPTYPSGQIGFMLSSKAGSCRKPVRKLTVKVLETLRYYNAGIHEASFVLPQFAKKIVRPISGGNIKQ